MTVTRLGEMNWPPPVKRRSARRHCALRGGGHHYETHKTLEQEKITACIQCGQELVIGR